MRKILLLMVCVSVFVGIGYLSGKYIVSNTSLVDDDETDDVPVRSAKQSKVETVAPKINVSFLSKIKKNTELDDSEKLFLQRLGKVNLGQEIFWLTKAQALEGQGPEYHAASEELKGQLCSESRVMLQSLDEFINGLPALEFPLEKLRLLRLVMLCNDHLDLAKSISQAVLEKEVISRHLDLAAARNEEENNSALTSRLEINVVLTAHAVFMESVSPDVKEAWQGTKDAMQAQKGNWMKSRLAQQFLKKYPSERETIRAELMALVGTGQNRAPASEQEEEAPRE